ncbi:RNA polymerase sigma factor [Spirosoma foliorum]|uniref:Sigma-70 family RNA polymerase sigma factor n=1 Tax=Spirosoma foliorum TaxID=2710596 RepID=A0A7G5H2S7_9BACT|nr:sigma-70 family RNA polymerase sigma factor [Spirosoma foliorum]QMW05419.1 sigma-70 family RNA polymerase sigma factor [Spirosoma foliorum]
MVNSISDPELLKLIAQQQDEIERNKAFDIFYIRHRPFLWNVLSRICREDSSDDEVKRAILQNTFYQVLIYAGSFQADSEGTPEVIERNVQGWLIVIARQEYQRLLSDRRYPPDDAINAFKIMKQASNSSSKVTYKEDLVQQALAKLSPRDRHILLTYYNYYEKGKGKQARNLPPDVLESLARQYNVKKDNLRKIIQRGNDAVKQHIENQLKADNRTLYIKRDEQ